MERTPDDAAGNAATSPPAVTSRLGLVSTARCRALLLGFSALRFLRPPPMSADPERDRAFDELLDETVAGGDGAYLDYRLPYPKHEFLRYLVAGRDVLLHGTTAPDTDCLEPQVTPDWQGKPRRSVFAASDGIWPLFFATLNRSGGSYALRNACCTVDDGHGTAHKFYLFAIDSAMAERDPWTDGRIYILARDAFRRVSPRGLMRDEWASNDRVAPIARLAVSPGDFPFRDRVVSFNRREPIARTWLRGVV